MPKNEQAAIISFKKISEEVQNSLPKDFSIQIIGKAAIKLWSDITPTVPSRKSAIIKVMDGKYVGKIAKLNSVNYEDTYTGSFTERRAIIYTFNFTAKTYVYGPVSTDKPVTDAQVKTYTDLQAASPTRVQKITAAVTTAPDADDNFGFNETTSEWV